MVALGRYEAHIHACGFHSSVLEDKTNLIQPEWEDCAICALVEQSRRMKSDEDEKALKARYGDTIPPGARRPSDGRTMLLRQLTAAQVEERHQRAASRASSSGPSSTRGRRPAGTR